MAFCLTLRMALLLLFGVLAPAVLTGKVLPWAQGAEVLHSRWGVLWGDSAEAPKRQMAAVGNWQPRDIGPEAGPGTLAAWGTRGLLLYLKSESSQV